MRHEIKYKDFGLIEYQEAWKKQQELFDLLVERKLRGSSASDCLVLCEHPHVYTLGKSGQNMNLLISDDFLKRINATFFKIDRGGDITYHGPGQLVGYPIIDLEVFGFSLKEYIHKLEDVIIKTIASYGLKGERLDGATGVWLDPDIRGRARKVCAIGVKASRFITMHGFALNVNTNMDYFTYINPCGFTDKGVTSLEKELGHPVDIEKVKGEILDNFLEVFSASLNQTGR